MAGKSDGKDWLAAFGHLYPPPGVDVRAITVETAKYWPTPIPGNPMATELSTGFMGECCPNVCACMEGG